MKYADFSLTAPRTDRPSRAPVLRRFVVPCWFFELHLRFFDSEALARLHRAMCASLGTRLTHHGSDASPRVTRARDPEAALGALDAFLASKRSYVWLSYTNVGLRDSAKEPAGVGDAALSYWLHRADPASRAEQVARYQAMLRDFDTDMLAFGVTISVVQACFPLDHFASAEAFAAFACELVRMPFFSGTAGIRLRLDTTVAHAGAEGQLAAWLAENPGLDFDPGLGNRMGRVLRPDGADLVPVVRRPSFLTFVSEEADDLLDLGALPAQVGVHALPHGRALQAGGSPALRPEDPDYDALLAVVRALRPIAFRPHPRDSLSPRLPGVAAWAEALR